VRIRTLASSVTLTLTCALLFLNAAAAPPAAAQSEPPAPVVAWAAAHITPLENLQPFDSVIGHARVIGLGEAAHGVQQFYSFRNRLVESLIERGEITAIAAETGYSESVAADDYINGRGDVSPRVVGSVFSWSMDASYSENRALLDWLRAYNARTATKRKIHFYGVDLTGGRAGRFVDAHVALDAALRYVAAVDTQQARILNQRLTNLLPRFSSAGHDSLTAPDQNALTAAISDLVSLFERRQLTWQSATSAEAYDRAYHQAIVARQLDANFRSASPESNPQAQREAAMAQNLLWVLSREGLQSRIFLYAANWHISKGPMWTDRFGTALGEHVRAMLGRDYVAIGTTYSNGDPAPSPTSVGAMLDRLGVPEGLLSLHDVPSGGPVAEWFRTPRGLVGGRIDSMAVNQAFDAVVFIGAVRPAETDR